MRATIGLTRWAPPLLALAACGDATRSADHVARAGRRIWIQEYVPTYEERAPRWWVFDADGAAVAVVALPPRFSPHQITDDRILGVGLDSLDVPAVQVLRVRR
jgi:hypothetical protein